MKSYSEQIQAEETGHQFGQIGLLQKINFLRRFFQFFRNRGFNKLTARRRVAAMVALVLIILGGYSIYQKYFHLTPTQIAQKELAAAVAGVSKLIILPQGDEPVLATVTDAKTLIAQQAFFAGAVNGDQLLLFPRNLKAVLWSPSRNVIVNVGPIQQPQSASAAAGIQTNTPASAPLTVATTPIILSVEIRNGTGKTGRASTVADQLRSNAGYSVTKVTDANKKDYTKTIVFSRVKDDSRKQAINTLAAMLNGDLVDKLPNGEKNTDADVLVILGGNE